MGPGWGLSKFVPPVLEKRLSHLDVLPYLRTEEFWRMRSNRELRDRHRGERCFVLGNGPSLRNLDIHRLEQERIFTVNRFVTEPNYSFLSPFVHCFFDPAYFDGSYDGGALLSEIGRMPDRGTTFFLPLVQREAIRRHVPSTAYPRLRFFLNSRWSLPAVDSIDISSVIPSTETVAGMALLLAIYMGFSEIYLLGCEMDFLSNVVGVDPLRVRIRHFYEDNRVQEDIHDLSRDGFDYGAYAASAGRMFGAFAFLKRKAQPWQRIYNATPGGVLDVFPRVDFADLFR